MIRSDQSDFDGVASDRCGQFGLALLAIVQDLKVFGRSLTGDADAADDLVQETMLRAWAARDSFDLDSSMRAWTFTILRNAHHSRWRRTRRETHWNPELDDRLAGADSQQHSIDLAELHEAMSHLPPSQREALLLVGAGGWSYKDAARMSDCQPGTMKSRVSRARAALLAADADQTRGQARSASRFGGAEAYQSIVNEVERSVSTWSGQDWSAMEAAE